MKNVRQFFATLVLVAVLSVAASAGDQNSPGAKTPLPPPPGGGITAVEPAAEDSFSFDLYLLQLLLALF